MWSVTLGSTTDSQYACCVSESVTCTYHSLSWIFYMPLEVDGIVGGWEGQQKTEQQGKKKC
jgi:hypothetical protein